MKVAVLAPVAWRTPPRKYGPWELVASNMTEGLVARGLDVTLFATGDSLTNARLEHVCPQGYEEDNEADAKVSECLHIGHLMEKAGQFDIIHNHFDFLPLTYSRLINTPVVTTIHGFSSKKILAVYQKYNDSNHYVSISYADRDPSLKYRANVYNGVKTADFTFRETPEDYLLYFGRIHHHKGTCEAIRIAEKANRRLLISGFIQDKDYFESQVKPFLDDDKVVYVGNSGPDERDKLLGGACALLHPINFDEPFGLSVAESMFCGTPVIAFDRGAMSELIVHGKTGFLVNNVEEAAAAVAGVKDIDRAFCRSHATASFSQEKMVEGYIRVYESIVK